MKNRDYLNLILELSIILNIILALVLYIDGKINEANTFYLNVIICKIIIISRDLELKK
jgi:hypothetical protein